MHSTHSINRGCSWAASSVVLAACLLHPAETAGQGCIAIRSSGSPALPGLSILDDQHPWQAAVGYRYLYADRYFQGSEELSHLGGMSPGEQVINEIHSFDIIGSYTVNNRLSLTLDLPVVYGERTSRHEHFGGMNPATNPQFTTSAAGVGDLRLTADFWLLNPTEYKTGNIALGAGLKAPTGEDNAEDDFRTGPGTTVRRAVDQAIQPGDGGWGIILQMQAYQQIVGGLSLYANGSYLINPREVNGTQSFSPATVLQDQVNSVPDQYLGRAGLNYLIWPEGGVSLSVGGRVEGLPVNDLIGGNDGFRRPGYVISIEPGVSWVYGRHSFNLTTPVALERNRQRSEADRVLGRMYDASFADWSLQASYAIRF